MTQSGKALGHSPLYLPSRNEVSVMTNAEIAYDGSGYDAVRPYPDDKRSRQLMKSPQRSTGEQFDLVRIKM
jgi:hypothetical protein